MRDGKGRKELQINLIFCLEFAAALGSVWGLKTKAREVSE